MPFIKNNTSQDTPIITCGASLGALHSANLFFRRPDLFDGAIGMSGAYLAGEVVEWFTLSNQTHDRNHIWMVPAGIGLSVS